MLEEGAIWGHTDCKYLEPGISHRTPCLCGHAAEHHVRRWPHECHGEDGRSRCSCVRFHLRFCPVVLMAARVELRRVEEATR